MKFLQNHAGTALAYRDKLFTFTDLLRSINSYKEIISKFRPQKVMIFSGNRPEYIYAFYGALMERSVVVPVDIMATAPELKYMMEDCTPELIFCSAEKKEMVEGIIKSVKNPPELLVLDDLQNLQLNNEVNEVEIKDLQKTAVIIYTSGTTGSPKGVMLSFENLFVNIKAVTEDIKIFGASETTMLLLPLHHIFPLIGSMAAPLFAGGKVAMSPSLATEDILNTLQQHKVSIIIGVPRLYAAIRKGVMDKINAKKAARVLFSLASKLKSRSFSKKIFKAVHQKFGGNIKYMVCGGAPLEIDVASDYQTLGFEMLEGYGMTEAAPMISFTRPDHWVIGAAGQVMPGTTVEIRDGEIVASGKNIMQGYYNRPEETLEVLRDGWLYTGDLGEVDKDNFVRITGRKKEIIILSNGKNINPVPLEAMLIEKIEGISEVGIMMHHDKLHAVILPDTTVLAAKQITDPSAYFRNELNEKFNKEVSSSKKITAFTLVKMELPRTRLGKIQRFKLAEMLIAPEKEAAKKYEKSFEEYDILSSYLKEQKSVEVMPDDNLEFDLGLDSLDKVGLQTWLEKSFGVEMKVENLMNFPSVVKLAEYIREKKNKLHLEKINWSDILKEKVTFRYPTSWYFSQMTLKLSKYIFKVYFRMKYDGLQNIPTTSCIIAPNHQSSFDGFFIASLLNRKTFSRTYFYAKEKHIRQRWLKFLATRNNIIIVDLNNDLRLSIQKMAMALQNNKNIIIFPEGTRSKDGSMGQFKETFAILSRELGVPVVPVAIDGAWRALPSGSLFPRPFRQVTVNFLTPILPGKQTYKSLSETVRNSIQTRLAS